MKTILVSFTAAIICLLSACGKNDNVAPDPVVPAPKPDTLSAGWRKVTLPNKAGLADIFFNNNTTGYLTGEGTYKSIDGGLTWNAISNSNFSNIAVTNNGNVYFVGRNDSIYRSTDGGTTIIPVKTIARVSDVYFTDNNNGYCITVDGVCNTTNGGLTWNKITATGISFAFDYSSIFFSTTTSGWAVSLAGVYKTNNSGATWTRVNSFPGTAPSNEFLSVFVTPNNNIYICNRAGELYRSVDGGISFTQLKAFPGQINVYCDIHFVDNNTGYVCVNNRIYKTIDAGATWNVVAAMGESIILEVHFTDAAHGWACGSNGTVLIFN